MKKKILIVPLAAFMLLSTFAASSANECASVAYAEDEYTQVDIVGEPTIEKLNNLIWAYFAGSDGFNYYFGIYATSLEPGYTYETWDFSSSYTYRTLPDYSTSEIPSEATFSIDASDNITATMITSSGKYRISSEPANEENPAKELFNPDSAGVDHTWGQFENPEATWDKASQTLTIEIKEQSEWQWGNQVFFSTGITTLDTSKEYQISFTGTASTDDCGEVTFKAFDDNSLVYLDQNLSFTTTPYNYVSEWATPLGTSTNGCIVFDFGWDAAQTVTITNISIKERSKVVSYTIADILTTVEGGFPSSSDGNAPSNAWVNSNNEKMFSCEGDLYVGGESDGDFVLSANTELTKDGNNYKCTKDGAAVTFIMDDGALTSISIEGLTDDAKLNGTYAAPVTGPDAMPTAPTLPASQVKAVYSAVYGADCDFSDWGSGTTYAQEDYGKKFTTTSLGYLGLSGFNLNCSTMKKLHMDVWFTEAGTFRVIPVHGGNEKSVTITVAASEVNSWKSVDIALNEGDLAQVTDWTSVYQIKIEGVYNKTFWMNNIYFYASENVFASLEELVTKLPATDTTQNVTVTITDAVIDSFYVSSKGYTNGIYVTAANTTVELYCNDVPETWEVGGKVSGTIQAEWLLYKGTAELQKWTGGWSAFTYTAPGPEISVYTIAGQAALMGSDWDQTDTANDMTNMGNGTFQLVKENVTLSAGDYEYKVVGDHTWGVGECPEYGNQSLTIEEDAIYTITFNFTPATPYLTADAVKTGDFPKPEYKYTTYENWQIKYGNEWTWSDNMDKIGDGLYKIEILWENTGFNVKSDENPIKKDWYDLSDPDVIIADECIAPIVVDIYLKVIDDETLKIGIGEVPHEPHEHAIKTTHTKVEAKCLEAGHQAYYECDCGKYFSDQALTQEIENLETWLGKNGDGYIAPIGHDIGKVNGTPATEDSDGFKDAYKCNNCGKYFEDEQGTKSIGDETAYNAWKLAGGKIGKLSHDIVKVSGSPATADSDGFKDAYKCKNCGKYFEDKEGTKSIGDETAYDAWKVGEGKIPALNPNNGKSANGGAIAGIIIGSFFGLLLIAFIVLYILWKLKDIRIPLLEKILTPAYRWINNLLFKTKLNNVEKKDAEEKHMSDEDYLKAQK